MQGRNEMTETASATDSTVQPVGFVSYVHKDNERTKGRMLGVVQEIADEFSLITGEDLEIFVDRTSLEWGDKWRDKINNALQDTTFFIPLVTPAFFKSQECRNELLKFAAAAKSVDAADLLLPILYIDVDDLSEDSDDEAVVLIAETQYVEWMDLRLEEESSAKYRQAINACAKRLAKVSADYAARAAVLPAQPAQPEAGAAESSDDWDDEAPGLVDHIARVEERLPRWGELLVEWSTPAGEIGDLVTEAGRKMDKGTAEGKAMGYRILVAQELAKELDAPATRLRDLGEEYLSTVLEIDAGVRAIISYASEQTDEDARREACEMFTSLRGFVESAGVASTAVTGLIESMQTPAKSYKDLRRPLGVMRTGLRNFLDAQAIYDEWDRMIASSPLDCGAYTTSGE